MTDIPGWRKIKKYPPFDLSLIKPEYPRFPHLLVPALNKLTELPDFSEDSRIAVFSDFSGEHKQASFHTYSFLIMAQNKVGPFLKNVERIRQKYRIAEPYSEFAFKDLTYGPRSRALTEFLSLVDSQIHGALVTIAIDKEIETVFGNTRKETHPVMEKQLADLGLGKWKGATAEKVLRVCHSIALFTALTTKGNQRLLWYCDTDAINEDTGGRRFENTQKIFGITLSMYCKHEFELIGFAKSLPDKSYLDDLLSVPDFAAGVVQDLLQSHKTGEDIPGGEEKRSLIQWIATERTFLSKITIQVSRTENGELGSGLVGLTLNQQEG